MLVDRATRTALARRLHPAGLQERFYGIEAILKDNSGHWFSMTQPPG